MESLTFFDDVFPAEFCRWLLEDSRANLARGRGFSRSNHHWDPVIVRASQPVLVRDYEPELARLILAKLRDRGVVEDLDYIVMNYAWSRLSYIPWHNDAKHCTAITIFLNPQWDRDWGGLFLYRDGEESGFRGIEPRFNTGLRNDGNLEHATTPVAIDAPEPRFTLQLFKTRD